MCVSERAALRTRDLSLLKWVCVVVQRSGRAWTTVRARRFDGAVAAIPARCSDVNEWGMHDCHPQLHRACQRTYRIVAVTDVARGCGRCARQATVRPSRTGIPTSARQSGGTRGGRHGYGHCWDTRHISKRTKGGKVTAP